MTNSSDESDDSRIAGISDDQLPEDLQPEESPLAAGLEAGETAGGIGAGELLEEGKSAETGEPEESATAESTGDDD